MRNIMKHYYFFFFFLYVCSYSFAQQGMTLNNATQRIATEVTQKLSAKSTLAVLTLKSLSDDLTLHIIMLLENAFVNTDKLQIVSRQRIEVVLMEQDLGLSGYVDDTSAQRIGKILGASYILTGDLINLEKKYYLNIQVIETETARILYSNSLEIRANELSNYERLVILKQKQEQMERERLIKEEEHKQKDAIAEIKRQERERGWENFKSSFFRNVDFNNWSPVPKIFFQGGYNYASDIPFGLQVGAFGGYFAFNYLFPNLGGYGREDEGYDGDGKVNTYLPENWHYRGVKTYEAVEFVFGYKFNLVTGLLMLQIGVGGYFPTELRLFDHRYGYSSNISETKWFSSSNDENIMFVFETGLQFVLFNYIYLSGTWRTKGFEKNSFTISAGVIFLKKKR
jgi:TolB-like protein